MRLLSTSDIVSVHVPLNQQTKHLINKAACLDVFESEPLPIDSELRNLGNVILTPHTAGMPDGRKFHKKRYDFFIKNIKRIENGEEPVSKLNQL
ncbi:NAD(P)-dependent oxidoreductase [Niallia circulans]|uniref:NAD(P)-dependent oxidoreductase n=1 Tax=Niallia TaxID=2837506 RepID=UPI0022875634